MRLKCGVRSSVRRSAVSSCLDTHPTSRMAAATAPRSALFAPYRTIGLVCDGAQMCTQALGTETFFYASVGRAFHVYKCDHLGLSLVSRQGASVIRCAARAAARLVGLGARVVRTRERLTASPTPLTHLERPARPHRAQPRRRGA